MSQWQAIPGETPIDPSGLKDRSIKTRSELNRAEALNIRKAHLKYLAAPPSKRLAPFDYSWLLRLHEEMYGDVWEWAGQLRQRDLNLGVPWTQAADQILLLTRDLPYWAESSMPLIEQATRLHQRAVWIHPFQNGNGRWARLLANIWLRRHQSPLVHWPEDHMGQDSPVRVAYLAALQAADAGDFEPLLALHFQYASRPAG